MFKCNDCNKQKPISSFYKDKKIKRGHDLLCKLCRDKRNKQWRKNNWNKMLLLNAASRKRKSIEFKLSFVEAYGGKCECCGQDDPHFLTMEHINGVPEKDRWPNGRRKATMEIIRRLKKEGWPKGEYTILCWNCNCAKNCYGYCPHEPGSERRF